MLTGGEGEGRDEICPGVECMGGEVAGGVTVRGVAVREAETGEGDCESWVCVRREGMAWVGGRVR
jgi:hypothetical protein